MENSNLLIKLNKKTSMKRICSLLALLMVCFFSNTTLAEVLPTQNIHFEWSFEFQPIEGKALEGFRLYKEGVQVCEVRNPNINIMDCTFLSEDGSFDFTLTAFLNDGTESLHSDPYNFTLVSTSTPETLQAVILTSPIELTADAPFSISMDARPSTGNIVSYLWSFGDGETAQGERVEHTYMAAGAYTTTLTVTDSNKSSAEQKIKITALNSSISKTPPTAIMSSSSAVGPGPLNVTFDSLRSSPGSSSIVSQNWSFGDGTSAAGPSVSHQFFTAGTFNTVLTVTNEQGLTAQASTPVIVTQASSDTLTPIAKFTASPTQGTTPLTVLFNGSSSTDADGKISTYSWNFGDGSFDSGVIVEHTYNNPAQFIATLQVTDNEGATATASTTIDATGASTQPEFNIELGEIEIDQNWVRVQFDNSFQHPVVIAGSPSTTDSEPCVVRLRNIDSTGFDIRLQEWDYLDGIHSKETINYLVMEQGKFTLDDGSLIETGILSDSMNFQKLEFSQKFNTTPVIMTSVATFNESDTVTSQIKDVSVTGFTYKMREQELSPGSHEAEALNYVAWEPGNGNLDNLSYEVGTTDNTVQSAWYQIDFAKEPTTQPMFLSAMQTTNGSDTSSLRHQVLQRNSIQVKVEEEQSSDMETAHTTEEVGYIVMSSKLESVPPTHNVDMDYKINFQPANASIPAGFEPDFGELYETTKGFGWIVPTNPTMARDRNSDLSPDQSYDTTLPATSDAVWQIDLPNGQYQVNLAIGDAKWYPANQYLQINGESVIIDFDPNAQTPWLEKQVTVDVDNGKLTLTFEQTYRTTLNWIKIKSIGDNPPTESVIAINYAINFQPASVDVPNGYLPDSGGMYDSAIGFGWMTPTIPSMARDRNSLLSPDQSYDTTLPATSDAVWQIDLPNGQYQVSLAVGDASWYPANQYLQINGKPIIVDFDPNAQSPWLEKQIPVNIDNGKLTLSFEQTYRTTLNWIKIHN